MYSIILLAGRYIIWQLPSLLHSVAHDGRQHSARAVSRAPSISVQWFEINTVKPA